MRSLPRLHKQSIVHFELLERTRTSSWSKWGLGVLECFGVQSELVLDWLVLTLNFSQETVQLEWVAFCWFLLCGGDCRRNCLSDWLSYWLDWFARLVECSLVVKVSLHRTHRSVVDEVSEALPCSGQLALGMVPVGPTQCETRWRAVLASFDKQYDTLIAKNPDATEEIKFIRTGLIKIGQLIRPLRSTMTRAPHGSDWST
jgi:hypothetical protein